jgi:hypothetical protein
MTFCGVADRVWSLTDLQSIKVSRQGNPHSLFVALPEGGIWHSRQGDPAFPTAARDLGLDLQTAMVSCAGDGELEVTVATHNKAVCLQGLKAIAVGDDLGQVLGVLAEPYWVMVDQSDCARLVKHWGFDRFLKVPLGSRSRV